MNKKLILGVLFAATLSTSCKNEVTLNIGSEYRDSKKWGKVINQDIVQESEKVLQTIVINGNVDMKFTQGESTTISLLGNEKAIELYDCQYDEENGKLTITPKDSHGSNPEITVVITSQSIKDITINGAGDLEMSNDINLAENLDITINGAGDLEIGDLTCNKLGINVNGAGDIDIKYLTCNDAATLSVNGVGDVEAKKVTANDVNIVVNGAGDVDVKVDCNNLNATAAGTGDINIKGKCVNFTKHDGALSAIDSRGLNVKNLNIK